MEADRPQWHTKVDSSRDECEGLAWRSGHVEVDALLAVPVAPRTELGPVLGVEGQAVDVVGRGPAGHPHDVVPGQVDRLPLDLVLQDGVDPAVKHRVLVRIEHFHGPNESLIYHLYPLRKSLEMTVFKVRPLVGVTKRPGVITTDLASHRSDAVGFAAPGGGQGFWFVSSNVVNTGLLMWFLLRFRRRWRRFIFNITNTIAVAVEVSEHLEARLVLLHRGRAGRLSFGKLEESLVLRHQLVVVVVVVQALYAVVRVVSNTRLSSVVVVVVVVDNIFVLLRSLSLPWCWPLSGSLSGENDLHWRLCLSLPRSNTRSWSAGRGGLLYWSQLLLLLLSVVFVFLLVLFILFFLFKWTLSVGVIISKPRGQSLDFRISGEELLYCQSRGRCRRVLGLGVFTSLLVVTAASDVFSARILSLVFCPKILIVLFSEILFDVSLFLLPQILLVVLFSASLALLALLAPEFFLLICFKILVGASRFVLFPARLSGTLTGVKVRLEVWKLTELAVDCLVSRHRVGAVVARVGGSLWFPLLAGPQDWSL